MIDIQESVFQKEQELNKVLAKVPEQNQEQIKQSHKRILSAFRQYLEGKIGYIQYRAVA